MSINVSRGGRAGNALFGHTYVLGRGWENHVDGQLVMQKRCIVSSHGAMLCLFGHTYVLGFEVAGFPCATENS